MCRACVVPLGGISQTQHEAIVQKINPMFCGTRGIESISSTQNQSHLHGNTEKGPRPQCRIYFDCINLEGVDFT